jgi:hypothetical protein
MKYGIWMCALLSAGLGASSLTMAQDSPSSWMACPLASVPLGKEPTIDGQIIKGEWRPTGKLQDMVAVTHDEDAGFAAPEQTQVWLTYTPTGLHVAFKVYMQQGVKPLVTFTQGHDKGMTDDAFEIFLQPQDKPGSVIYHLGGNAAGVSWDRRLIGKAEPDWAWNPKGVSYAAVIDAGNNWWTGEWTIPWKALDLEQPAPGTTWKANFVTNRRAPAHRLDSWAYWSKWADHANSGILAFAGKGPIAVYSGSASQGLDGPGIMPQVDAPYDSVAKPRKIDYQVEFLKKEKGEAGSFLKGLQDRRAKATGEAATFATLQQDIDATLAGYKSLDKLQKIESVPHEGWTGPWGGQWKADGAGDYLLTYRMRDVTDPAKPVDVGSGVMPWRVRTGVQSEVWPYLLTKQQVVVKNDMRAVPGLSAVKSLRAFISNPGQDKPLSETNVPYTGEPKNFITLQAESVPDASSPYEVRVQALDGTGKVLSESVSTFKKPAPPDWWVNRAIYGATPQVPRPWTPITWNAPKAGVWGREITFGNSALPQKILCLGHDLLATPIDLQLFADGKPLKWVSRPLDVVEQKPGHLTLKSIRDASGVRVTTTTRLEFDGFMLVDLLIEPIGKTATIDGLDLVMALKPENAEFLTNYRPSPGPGPGRAFPRYVGKTPDAYASPVMLTTWLGTDEFGLEWSSESSKGWYLTKPARAIQVSKKSDQVEARFHLIDAPMVLSGPRQVRFGLTATPTKPLPAQRLAWRIDAYGVTPPVPGITPLTQTIDHRPAPPDAKATDQDVKAWQRMFGGTQVLAMLGSSNWTGSSPYWHPAISDPQVAAAVRDQIKTGRDAGCKYMLWNGGWAVAPYGAEWDPWGKEMVASPLTPTFSNQFDHSYTSPFVEFLVGSTAANIKATGMAGYRLDTVFPWNPSVNPFLGETWTSDVPGQEGEVHGTQALYRQRELAKRLFRLFNPEDAQEPAGLIYHPLAGPPIMAIESFVDIHEIGEGAYQHAGSLKEGYPQESARVWFTGNAYGFLVANNLKGTPLSAMNRLAALLVVGASPRMSARVDSPSYTPANPEQMPTRKIWEAYDWIDRPTARWCPHWSNKGMVKVTGAGEHYVSMYLQSGKRVLLIASNYEKAGQNVSASLDAQALGFGTGTKLAAKDAITGESLPVDGQTLKLDVGGELFRMVMVWAQEGQ